MAICFNETDRIFTLRTANTSYVFRLTDRGFLQHVYYGDIKDEEKGHWAPGYVSFSPYPFDGTSGESEDILMSEYPHFGNGDYRSDAVRIKNQGGDSITVFRYSEHKVINGRVDIPDMPYAEEDDECETLEITGKDDLSGCTIHLYYTVYPKYDIISRYTRLDNPSDDALVVEKAMSCSIDLPKGDYELIYFPGRHAMERIMEKEKIGTAKKVLESRRGATSHQMNNSFIVADEDATETKGMALGLSFVYSGDFRGSVETDQCGTVRILHGLNPETFSWLLAPGESFTTPEVIFTLSTSGFGDMSRRFHRFARDLIIRHKPSDKDRRPVVLNSWEGNLFDIDEKVLEEYAKEAAKVDVDMLVMDDGWFGKRVNDRAGLGDWYANPDRFPDGLAMFVRRIKNYGIKFGIWIEPEMVNPDSDLYRNHPEWVLCAKGRTPSLSRHQAVLDFTNDEVIEYLKESFSKTFEGVDIDYIKWDFNRHLSQVASKVLPPERQKETAHRYMIGVYKLYRWFCEKYPDVMIENCSGGGGRYDFGMMKYCSMIWTSDNTDPYDRILIQYASSFFYPACEMSCHVANHDNSAEDPVKLEFGYSVAKQGMLGYEFDITKLSEEVKKSIKKQIKRYKDTQYIVEEGDLYRLESPFEGDRSVFYYLSPSKNEIFFEYLQPYAEERSTLSTYPISISGKEGWISAFGDDYLYSYDSLKRGLVLKSSTEDDYSIYFRFIRALDDEPVRTNLMGVDTSKDEKYELSEYELEEVRKKIGDNKDYLAILKEGDAFRVKTDASENISTFYIASKSREQLLMFFIQKKAEKHRQYRLPIMTGKGSIWYACPNSYGEYRYEELYTGLVFNSKEQDNVTQMMYLSLIK